MTSFLHAFCLLSVSQLVIAQSSASSAKQSSLSATLASISSSEFGSATSLASTVDSTTSDSGAAATSDYAAVTSSLAAAQSSADASISSFYASISSADVALSSSEAAYPSTYVDPSASDLGILQLVTPTMHANQVEQSALIKLSEDAFSFFTSYTQVDPFDYGSALALAINSQPPAARASLVAGEDRLIQLYVDSPTSLLDNPTSYLSRLQVAASPYPAPLSSSLLSQATGILLGYQSLVSQDVLSKSASSGPITPGMSISVGPVVTGAPSAGGSKTPVSVQSTGTVGGTSSSKAGAMPLATGSTLLMINAAAAAVGIVGIALM